MKTINLTLPSDLADFYETNKESLALEIERLLRKEREIELSGGAQEMVRVITRSKARVLNWEDLEREILKGAIS